AADDVETKLCRAARQDERVARRAGDEPRVGELHGARVAVDDERAAESAAAAANDAVGVDRDARGREAVGGTAAGQHGDPLQRPVPEELLLAVRRAVAGGFEERRRPEVR